jgi:nucleotide sugar dehydrogenase
VRGAAEVTGRLLRPGMLVVLESTTYPGTTDEVVRPLLEKASGLTAGTEFSLAFSPERIDPGNPDFCIRNTPKVVGGQTPSCADAAERFYGKLCDQVVRARSAREAEMTKLLENTYRHINIALVNEMAIFSHELGVDLRDAIRCAATKPFGFQAFHPGPGVGGHCIPIDPNYLSYKVRTLGYPFRFVELAQEINGRMPGYIVDRAAELLNRNAKPLNGARVLLLGVTYKPDVADQRESPVRLVGRKLCARGAVLTYHDPFVAEWRLNGEPVRRAADLDAEVARADLVILLQDHSAYDLDRISRDARLVLDTRPDRGSPHRGAVKAARGGGRGARCRGLLLEGPAGSVRGRGPCQVRWLSPGPAAAARSGGYCEGRASVSVETPSRKAALAGWLFSIRQSWCRMPSLWAMSNHTSPSVLYRRIPSNRLLILGNWPARGPTAVSDSRMGLSEKIRTRVMVSPKTLAKVSERR